METQLLNPSELTLVARSAEEKVVTAKLQKPCMMCRFRSLSVLVRASSKILDPTLKRPALRQTRQTMQATFPSRGSLVSEDRVG